MMFHTGNFFSYTAIAIVYREMNASIFITINGPWLPRKAVTFPLSYLISDMLLKEEPWLNSSLACDYPSPWRRISPSNHTEQNNSLPVYKDMTEEEATAYVGLYGHLLFGNINITYKNQTLVVSLTSLMDATLHYIEEADLFDLKLSGPLGHFKGTGGDVRICTRS